MKLPKIKKRQLQKADVVKTHGNNLKIIKNTGFKNFTNFEMGLLNTLKWYKAYNRIN